MVRSISMTDLSADMGNTADGLLYAAFAASSIAFFVACSRNSTGTIDGRRRHVELEQ